MAMRRWMVMAGVALAGSATAAQAEQKPMALPITTTIPAAVDATYPGRITLDIDARGAPQGIVSVRETIPVPGPGPVVLLYPKWHPGNHAATGEITRLAGLSITANGKPMAWIRDTVDVYAFHLDVPAGAKTIEARFQYLSPLSDGNDRIVATSAMLNMEWDAVSLYPAGYYVRDIPVKASVVYPEGWTAFAALRGTKSGSRIDYDVAPYDILLDSPVQAGRYAKQIGLDPAVTLDIVADTADELAIAPAQVEQHKALVVQADRLFGARHFDHYDFLVAVSNTQSGEGLEHHRSSENTLDADLFTDWDGNVSDHYVVAHEFTHSWNGKYRRPADLWTPDYRTPMQNSLLWVYEGQTQFWGDILAARSGLWTKEQYLDTLASTAALYAAGTPGAEWRPLQDTTNDPILTGHGGAENSWGGWTRGYDYYRNAELIWLDADQIIRAQTGGARGLDDFAKLFFGVHPGEWDTEDTYRFTDVVAALNQVAPYDWENFLRQQLDGTAPTTVLAGIEKAGYRLVFTDTPSKLAKDQAAKRHVTSLAYSLGMTVNAKGELNDVLWNGPAYRAGLKPHDKILAVDGTAFDPVKLTATVTAAKATKGPMHFLINDHDRIRTVAIDYHQGLRYPHLAKVGTGDTGLDRLLAPR